ncbi:MAG TPA: hypothetical protein VFE45_12690 [Coriobacteriia bacterium]|nr:hypothetical protein [Coriobacteriia bacterium]
MSDDDREAHDRIVLATEQAMVAEGLTPVQVLILGEVIADDGERWIFKATSHDMRQWDSLGFLQWAIAREAAGVAADYQRDNDEETP